MNYISCTLILFVSFSFISTLHSIHVFDLNKASFVNVDKYLPVDLDIRYASTNNFTHRQLYKKDTVFIRKGTADKLRDVCEELSKVGLHIKVWDAYRPPSVQKILWEYVQDSRYIANPNKGFSNHSRGSAIDITLVDSNNNELPMPSEYDDFSTKADRNFQDATPTQRKNVQFLGDIMSRHGFSTIQTEWWHFEDKEKYPVVNEVVLPDEKYKFGSFKALSFQINNQDNSTSNSTINLTISAIGDNVLGTDPRFPYKGGFTETYDNYGPNYFYRNVKNIFNEDDLTIANLETTLTQSNDPVNKDFQAKPFFFIGQPGYAQILHEAGIDAVNLANNHSMDYQGFGYEDTISALYRSSVDSFGYDRSAIITRNGVKIGLLGYNLLGPLERGVNISTLKDTIFCDINRLRNDCGLIIISFHWGEENSYQPNAVQKELGHWAVDQGADLILGHHPHVIQPLERYKGKYIIYSLGNFCFGGNYKPVDMNTFIYQQNFQFSNGKLLEIQSPKIIPCFLSSMSNRNNFQPSVTDGNTNSIIFQLLNYHLP